MRKSLVGFIAGDALVLLSSQLIAKHLVYCWIDLNSGGSVCAMTLIT